MEWGGCRSEEHCFVGDIGSTIREIVSGRLVRLLEPRTRAIAETLNSPKNQQPFPFQILFAPCISLADHRIQFIPHNVSPLPALSHSDLCFGSSVPNTAAQKLYGLLRTFILLNTVPIGGPCASIRSAVELRQGTIGPWREPYSFQRRWQQAANTSPNLVTAFEVFEVASIASSDLNDDRSHLCQLGRRELFDEVAKSLLTLEPKRHC